MSVGGAIQPVIVIADADLRQNGGEYEILGGDAIPVEAIAVVDIGSQNIGGGERIPVYVVGGANVAVRQKKGGKPIKMSATATTRAIKGHKAQPIVIVTGAF